MLILKNSIFGYLVLIWHFLFQDLALDPRENLATLVPTATHCRAAARVARWDILAPFGP